MNRVPQPWDCLIVTASNDVQARAYESQLSTRRRLGLLSQALETRVVADPQGRRVGSGGSTLYCLSRLGEDLRGRRILIVHAGGDSRRLPAYAPCGKLFVPLPGAGDSALGTTLFDRLAANLLDLPPGADGAGQIVVAAGDALLLFDPAAFPSDAAGVTALAGYAAPAEASRHGVFCPGADGSLRLYLQKPSEDEQRRAGAIDRDGRALLDLGLMSLDAATAERWLSTFGEAYLEREIDLYREICCAMGAEATPEHYLRSARASGSPWDDAALAAWFPALAEVPLAVRIAPRCRFLHFGATRQLVESGLELLRHDQQAAPAHSRLLVNCEVGPDAEIAGSHAWIEACRLNAPLTLGGGNVVVGVDVDEPLDLPPAACLEVLAGATREGAPCWFVRCYGERDSFKDDRFCDRPLSDWIDAAGLWEAPVFPAVSDPRDYRRWLWMFDAASATEEEKRAWREADRYSAAEIARFSDQDAFHHRRAAIRAGEIRRSLRPLVSRASAFSAGDLAHAMAHADDPAGWTEDLLAEARSCLEDGGGGLGDFLYCRIVHSLGTAVPELSHLRDDAFRQLNRTILRRSMTTRTQPRNALRPDETIWGRAPARIELGGGWTDTPPYTLEHGGDVINAAVNLNGQPPIHCYCRVVDEPVIRLSSIDTGRHLEIAELDDLLDYRRPGDGFALAKAALVISGFSPDLAEWPAGFTLRDMLTRFGGGIELTTLVGIPKGSGLGTSSILGAVLIAVVERMMGRTLTPRELFHNVLRLEQALTTGGGWQDQIGGGVGGCKITSTAPGLFPDPRIHYVPDDVIDPRLNGGSTLLYYTGMTRIAKDILQQIVGGYLNRDRAIMRTLAHEHRVAAAIADAMARKDAARFGHYVDVAWRLQKELCSEVTNPEIESLLERVRPYVHGMRISGAGSGGFLFMVCKSPRDAAWVREMLERSPLNDRSRFFDFEINHTGLQVTTC